MDYPHFSNKELQCRCGCKVNLMDDAFMQRLEALRTTWSQSMPVSSAYRCANHPVEKSKARPGTHNSGRAVDILIAGKEAYQLIQLAMAMGFTGVGISQKGDYASRFIHLDITNNNRPAVWSY